MTIRRSKFGDHLLLLCTGLLYLHLHCIAEIRAYWVETKPFEIDNLDTITRLFDNAALVCIHLAGRFSEDFLEVRELRSRELQLQVE